MKKITLMLMIASQFIAFTPEIVEEFDSSIEDGYSEYTVIDSISNQYYEFKVIQGINNNDVTYGFVLYNYEARSHTIQITANDKGYHLNANSRGDYNYPAVKLNDDIVVLSIVDEKNHIRHTCEIKDMTTEEFLSTFITVKGNNNPLSVSKVKRTIVLSSTAILTIVFASVIVLCSGILIFMAIGKKGMFNPEKRQKDVFNFKEFINNYNKDEQIQPFYVDSSIVSAEDNVKKDFTTSEVYKRTRFYDDEEEDVVDVENILMLKGYNINYDIATTDEKNKIMLELMRMRDFHEITLSQYQNEVIKLWKK